MSDSVSGKVGLATQKIHPPGAIISLQLTEPDMKPSPEPPASMNHYITCIPSDSFGLSNATEHWCKDFERGGSMAGDGTLTTYMMELNGPGWERSIQVRCSEKITSHFPIFLDFLLKIPFLCSDVVVTLYWNGLKLAYLYQRLHVCCTVIRFVDPESCCEKLP